MVTTKGWSTLGAAALAFSLVSWAQAPESAPQPERAERSELAEHVVWSDREPGRTLFIPEARLQAEARTSLPAHPDEIEAVLMSVRAVRAALLREGKSELECGGRTEGSTGPPSGSLSLVQLLRTQSLVAHGTVVEAVAGWGRGRFGLVQSLVYVRIDEILQCNLEGPARSVYPGDVVAILVDRGRIVVDGVVLCNKTDEVQIPPSGSEVLVSGFPYPGDPFYAGTGVLFEVSEGLVLPQPYVPLAERTKKPYKEVREEFEPGLVACEVVDSEGE